MNKQDLLEAGALFSQKRHLNLHHSVVMLEMPPQNLDAFKLVERSIAHPLEVLRSWPLHIRTKRDDRDDDYHQQGRSFFFGEHWELIPEFESIASLALDAAGFEERRNPSNWYGAVKRLWHGDLLRIPPQHSDAFYFAHLIHEVARRGSRRVIKPYDSFLVADDEDQDDQNPLGVMFIAGGGPGWVMPFPNREVRSVIAEAAKKPRTISILPKDVTLFHAAAIVCEVLAEDAEAEGQLSQGEFAAISGLSKSEVSKRVTAGNLTDLTIEKAREIRGGSRREKTVRARSELKATPPFWFCKACNRQYGDNQLSKDNRCPSGHAVTAVKRAQ